VKLDVLIDRETINGNDQDIAFVGVALTGRCGNLWYNLRKKVAVTAKRIGELIGFSSADQESEENYFDTERTVFDDHALAVICPSQAGIIRLTVKTIDSKTDDYCEIVTGEIKVAIPQQFYG
jgi:beta-galactosidase